MDPDAFPIPSLPATTVAGTLPVMTPIDATELLNSIESSSLEHLIPAIPLIAQLPEWNFISARKLLRRRLSNVSFEQRQRFELGCRRAASAAGSDLVRNRIDSLIA